MFARDNLDVIWLLVIKLDNSDKECPPDYHIRRTEINSNPLYVYV